MSESTGKRLNGKSLLLFLIGFVLLGVSKPAGDAGEGHAFDSVSLNPTAADVVAQTREAMRVSASRPAKALRHLQKAELMARQLSEDTLVVKVLGAEVPALFDCGLYNDVLEACFEGEQIARQIGDSARLIRFLFFESGVYNELGEFALAYSAAEEALQLSVGVGNVTDIGWSYSALAETYRLHGDYAASLDGYLRADSIFLEIQDEVGQLVVANNLAQSYVGLGEWEKAAALHSEIMRGLEVHSIASVFLETSMSAAKVALNQGDTAKSEQLLGTALETAHQDSMRALERKVIDELTAILVSRGAYREAFDYMRRKEALVEEIGKRNTSFQVVWLEQKAETQALKAENILLEEKERSTQIIVLILVILILVVLLGGTLLYRIYAKTSRLNLLLERRNGELDELNQEKDSLMQIVAHDLKAPLSNVQGLSSMMRSASELSPLQEQILMRMEKATGNGKELIENLLQLSILEAGTEGLKTVRTEMVAELDACIQGHRAVAEKKEISLEWKAPGQEFWAETIPSHFRRLVDNLLSNAIKYSEIGKRVWVEIYLEPDGRITTHVRDEGPGISEEDQKKMFRKFQKLTARPTAGESSTGLGLAIVKRLAYQLGTTVKVESRLGQGSDFFFSISPESPIL